MLNTNLYVCYGIKQLPRYQRIVALTRNVASRQTLKTMQGDGNEKEMKRFECQIKKCKCMRIHLSGRGQCFYADHDYL